MEEFIANNFEQWGPLAVFFLLMLTGVGIPLGEDLIVIPAGAFVAQGHMGFWSTVLAAFAGVVLSDMLWFGVCHRYGTRLLHTRVLRRLVHPRRLLEVKHQMDRRGAGMVLMARFIPGSRTTAITVSGMLHMPFWKFSVATMLGVLVSAPVQVGIGVLSVRVVGAEDTAQLIRLIFGLVLLMITVTLAIGFWRRTHRRRRPRARASWLRRFRIPSVRSQGARDAGRGSRPEVRKQMTTRPKRLL